jgi:ATP/maltotriose-dependent transcriptional regulator MalT
VKTHVARVYEKLEVQKRVQAIEKARWLSLIP